MATITYPLATGAYFTGESAHQRTVRVQRRAQALVAGKPVSAYAASIPERDAYLAACVAALKGAKPGRKGKSAVETAFASLPLTPAQLPAPTAFAALTPAQAERDAQAARVVAPRAREHRPQAAPRDRVAGGRERVSSRSSVRECSSR